MPTLKFLFPLPSSLFRLAFSSSIFCRSPSLLSVSPEHTWRPCDHLGAAVLRVTVLGPYQILFRLEWGGDQGSGWTRFILHIVVPALLEPNSPGAAGVTQKIGSERGSRSIQPCRGAFRIFRPGSYSLRMCGILGTDFEAT